jgi:hypothetical protein
MGVYLWFIIVVSMNYLDFRLRHRIQQSGNLEIFEDILQGQEHVRLGLKGNKG